MTPATRYSVTVLMPALVFAVTLPVNLFFNQPLITFVPTLAALWWSSRRIDAIRCPGCDTALRKGRFFLFGLDRCKACGHPLR